MTREEWTQARYGERIVAFRAMKPDARKEVIDWMIDDIRRLAVEIGHDGGAKLHTFGEEEQKEVVRALSELVYTMNIACDSLGIGTDAGGDTEHQGD